MKETFPGNAIEENKPVTEKTPEQRRRETRWADFEKLKAICEKDPDLLPLFNTLEQSVLTYVNAIAKMNHIEIRMRTSDKYDRTDLEKADHNRRIYHDSLITNLNILSRAFVPKKLDNTWRKVVGLDHRNQVTDWAIDIAQFLTSDQNVHRLVEAREE